MQPPYGTCRSRTCGIRSCKGVLRDAGTPVLRNPRPDPGKRTGPRPRRPVPFRDILHLARPAGDGREAHRRVAAQRLRRRDASHPCAPRITTSDTTSARVRSRTATPIPSGFEPAPDLPSHCARRLRKGISDSDTIVRHPASQRGVVPFGRNPGQGRYGASAPKGSENPLRRNAPGRGQIAFRPWIGVDRLPSGCGQVAVF